MRELDAWHGGRHRRVHDAAATADSPVTRAHDSPKHAAHDSPKLRMLLDPVARRAEHLRYRQSVEAYEAKHAAGQLKPKEAKPEHLPHETRDKPTSEIAERRKPLERQREERRMPERSRLPAADTVQMVAGNGLAMAAVAVAFNVLPDTWDKVAASIFAAVVGNVAWGNRRWKDKHGNRPED